MSVYADEAVEAVAAVNEQLAADADRCPVDGSRMELVGWVRQHEPLAVLAVAEVRPFRVLELLDAETDALYGRGRAGLIGDLKACARAVLLEG